MTRPIGSTHYLKSILLLVCALLLVGCSEIAATKANPSPMAGANPSTPTLEPSATTPVSVTATATQTPTPIPPSATPSITPSPTILPEARLQIQCLEIIQKVPSYMLLEGTLVLYQKGRPFGYLWSLENGTDIPLPDDILGSSVSPDGKWLVYEDLKESRTWFRVITADGQVHYSFPNDQEWIIGPWLNNEAFLTYRRRERLWSTVIVNPFTGQHQEFPSDHPEIFWIDAPYRGWGGGSFTASVYDPALTRVVYLANLPDTPSSKLDYAILDLYTDTIVADVKLVAWSVVEHGPVWSPSGNEFLVAYPIREESDLNYVPDDELYSVNRDGQITKLTNLSAYFTGGVDIGLYKWSPNGRYIAFWMEPNPLAEFHDPQMELAVLDMETQMVTFYCIPADFRRGRFEPIWAPNSQQVLVKSLEENGESRLVVVDIVQNLAVQIAGDVSPSGWMISAP